jgi:PKD repeat protein
VWSFGDGTPTATGVTTSHVFNNVGSYSVTVRVTDDTGLNATSTAIAVVTTGVAPTAAAAATTTTYGAAPLLVNFTASGSTDNDGSITSYLWSFGDGTPTATGVTTSHVFSTVGSFGVTVRVTDNTGLSATSAAIAVVTTGGTSTPPKAVAKATSATSGTAPLTVNFSAAKSKDKDGTIVSYTWSFGDGSTAGMGERTSHTFSSVGTHNVTVRVTDNSGLSTTSSPVTVTVLPANTHVSKLELKLSRQSLSTTATATVKVEDAAGKAVSGAAVLGTWSGVTPASTAPSFTDSKGKALFTASTGEKQGTAVFTVTSVSLSGTTYDPTANEKTSVSKPL